MYKVSKIKLKENLKETIFESINLIGGMDKFIKKGEVVLLKPNFNSAEPYPASTDLNFLKAVVEIFYDHGAKMVLIGESSTVSLNTRKVMEKLGVFDLVKMESPPRIYVFEEREWIEKEIPSPKYIKKIYVPDILERPDRIVLLPCVKTHKDAQFTGALKLSFGFVKPIQRVGFHLNKLSEKIAEINKIIHPDLIIADARKCFIKGGPNKGEIREPNIIMASDDRVSLDVEAVKIIQSFDGNSLKRINPWDLRLIKTAVEFGLGAGSENGYQVVEG